jgi:hypothetical protein
MRISVVTGKYRIVDFIPSIRVSPLPQPDFKSAIDVFNLKPLISSRSRGDAIMLQEF